MKDKTLVDSQLKIISYFKIIRFLETIQSTSSMIEHDSQVEPLHQTETVSLNQLTTVYKANSKNSGIFIFRARTK